MKQDTTIISLPRYSIISHQDQPCGKFFKNSKHKLSWKFSIQDEIHELICTVSKRSGKVSVNLDGTSLIETNNQGVTFQFEYPIKGLYLRIFLYEQYAQLYIEKQSSNRDRVATYIDGFLRLQNKYSSSQITDIFGQYY